MPADWSGATATTEGVEHRVLVQHRAGAWMIADEPDDERPQMVVDRLCGEGESRLTAEAVALDWIAQHSKTA